MLTTMFLESYRKSPQDWPLYLVTKDEDQNFYRGWIRKRRWFRNPYYVVFTVETTAELCWKYLTAYDCAWDYNKETDSYDKEGET